MVMTEDDRTTIMSQGRQPEPARGRHRPAALSDDYDEYDPYEDEDEERRRRRKKGWIIALVAVLALALIGFVAWLVSTVFNSDPVTNEVNVPNVIGQIGDDAQRSLTDQGFDVALKSVPCQPTASGEPGECGPDNIGKVIDSDPAPGSKMKKSDRLTLLVGAPAEKVNVPDVASRSPDEARQLLKDAGLAVAPQQGEREVKDDEQVGQVVETDPTAGQPVSKGSEIKLIVGTEPETVEVPDQTGKNVDDAKSTLEGLGLQVETNEVDNDQPPGTVVDQDPKDGEVEPGSTVTLDVSKGPDDQDQFQMPNILGLTQQEAEQQLRQLGWTGNFNVQDGQTNDPNEFNRIIETNRGEGQQVDKGDAIGITIATEFDQGGGG
jgi:serine/threonine-protein kinase